MHWIMRLDLLYNNVGFNNLIEKETNLINVGDDDDDDAIFKNDSE